MLAKDLVVGNVIKHDEEEFFVTSVKLIGVRYVPIVVVHILPTDLASGRYKFDSVHDIFEARLELYANEEVTVMG